MTAIVAATSADLDDVRRLFREYESEIGVDLCFQGFEQELANLPGAYSRPRGRLLIARSTGGAVGCVALRPLKNADEVCEMKRLYVQPAMRSTGLGRQLVERIVAEASAAGYRAMRLDTLARMTKAQQMYRRFGFREIPAYYPNPLPGVTYMELDLGREDTNADSAERLI